MTPRLIAYYDERYVTGRFGDPRPDGRIHEGTDFSHSRTPGLAPVPALLPGQVVNIWSPSKGHGYGHRVDIRTSEGVVSYAHLHARTPYWMGQLVAQGDIVGYEGTSGFVAGSCCHIEHAVNGRKRDPLPLIRAVLATNDSPAGQEEDDMFTDDDRALLNTLAARMDDSVLPNFDVIKPQVFGLTERLDESVLPTLTIMRAQLDRIEAHVKAQAK